MLSIRIYMAGRNSTFHYRAIVISLFIGFNLLPTQISINIYANYIYTVTYLDEERP